MSTARQPAPVTPPPAAQEVLQRHYAGAAARFAAFAVDVAVSTGVFLAALGGLAFAISIITRHSVSWSKDNIAVGIIFLAWLFTYYAYSWGAAGKTAGMALLGVRVVASDGAEAGPRRGVVRTLAFPLSFLFLGLGFLGILVQRDRRAFHDLIAGTVVIYDWDARAARLRFLARENRTDPADPAQSPFTQPG
jgi:uncharacterized RDD family membrane protein YckC